MPHYRFSLPRKNVRVPRNGLGLPRRSPGCACPPAMSSPPAKRVPPHLLHLFWNTAPAQLNVAASAPFIARRLITSFDPDGLAWGTANLPASAWEHAAATRGLEPAQRALAHNLARHAPHAV